MFLFPVHALVNNVKYKVVILFCLSFLLGGKDNLYGQNQHRIDSVKSVILNESDKEKQVDDYNTIAELYSSHQTDSAMFYAKKALKLAEQINYKKGEADSRFQLSYYYDREGEIDQAIGHLELACDLYIETGDSAYLTGCYNNLGVFYSYGTDQKKSLEYFIKALNLAEQLDETYSLSEAYYNIGTFYEYLSEYGLALKYYLKSLEIDTLNNDTEEISLSYINLGNINMKMHRLDDAYKYLLKAQKTVPAVKDQYSNILLNIYFADYFLETNSPDSAEIHINRAKEIYQRHDFERLKPDIIATEADLLLARKQYLKAINLYDEAVKIYKQQNTSDGLYDIYTSKAKAFEYIGKPDKAYQALQLANKANEVAKPNEIAKILGEFEQQEATKEKLNQFRLEQELLSQKKETDLLRIRSSFHRALYIIVFLVVLIGLAIYMYVIKRKNGMLLETNLETINRQKLLLEEQYKKLETSKKELSELNATKDKFFSILAHDLKNPFHTLMGLSEIVLSDKDVRHSDQFNELIEGIYQTASSGYNLLENLLEWSRSQTGNIVRHPQAISIGEIIKANVNFFQEILKEKKIEIIAQDSINHTVFADSNMMNFIVRNLLNNAIKFSFPESRIELSVQQNNEFCTVQIKDYGIGMDAGTINKLFKIDQTVQKKGTAGETGTGLGLVLCKEFVTKNHGEIWVESAKGKGSRFSFRLPVYNKN